MSTMLNTNSATLNEFLFEGVCQDDTPLNIYIETLEKAILMCGMLRFEVEFRTAEEIRPKIDEISYCVADTLNQLNRIKADTDGMVKDYFENKGQRSTPTPRRR